MPFGGATLSALKSSWAVCLRVVPGLTFSRFQAYVGTLAGLISIVGAACSFVQLARPAAAPTGRLVTIVQAADAKRSVSDAVVEVLTTEDAIVATLALDAAGQATKELREGVYVVRIRHPRYLAAEHKIHVLPQESVEIRAVLKAARPAATAAAAPARTSRSPIKRAAGGTVNAVKKVFRF